MYLFMYSLLVFMNVLVCACVGFINVIIVSNMHIHDAELSLPVYQVKFRPFACIALYCIDSTQPLSCLGISMGRVSA